MIRFHDRHNVEQLLDYPGCIAAVRQAMMAFSVDGTPQPLRSIATMAPGKLFAVMPGALVAPKGMGAKIITAYAEPDQPGRSHHRGIVVLFDRENGEPLAIGDAGAITLIRTAAASAVATDALARPDARRAAIFGTGEQARSHVLAMSHVRPFEEILIWGRSRASAVTLIESLKPSLTVPMRFEADAQTAAEAADVICTVTAAPTPVLRGVWVRPGTHVNIVGSSHAGPVEIDSDLVARAHYVADSRQSALVAAAEFLVAKAEGFVGDDHIKAEIGEVLAGTAPGRTSVSAITIYKSLGHIVQDLAALTYLDARTISDSAFDAGNTTKRN
jgi:ornithine cyclodeaminase